MHSFRASIAPLPKEFPLDAAPPPPHSGPKGCNLPESEAEMSDLAELETRIREALDRIGAGIDRLAEPPMPVPDPSSAQEIADLQALLAEERAARTEAEARLAELESALETAAEAPPPEVQPGDDRLLRQIDAQSLDNQRLRASVAALREEVRRLTEALAEGLADPALINHALAAEVEALRAQRASETTEITDILIELDRIVTEGEAAHA